MHFITSTQKAFFTGTFLLTAAGILSRIIGFFYRIFLSRTFGAECLGIYQLIFPVMSLCFSLTSAGIQTSISRFVSGAAARENMPLARLYLRIGLTFSVILSVLTGLFMWYQSSFLADRILMEPRCAPLLKLLAFCYLPCSIHSCINGYYYGLKKAGVPALSQLIEQLTKVGSVCLIYQVASEKQIPVTITLAIWGMLFSELAGMLVSFSFLGFGTCAKGWRKPAISLFRMTCPLAASRIILNLFSSIENLLIPERLRLFGYTSKEALSIYGILTGMAFAIILFPTVLTNSASVLLLPSVSEAQAKKDVFLLKRVIRLTVEACLFLGFLCTAGLLLFGNFIGYLLFQNALAGRFLVTLSWICPFLYLSAALNSVFHGLGKPSLVLLLNLSGCLIRIAFIYFLVPVIGIRGYLSGLLISHICQCVSAIFILTRKNFLYKA